jgi:hypothetical protein
MYDTAVLKQTVSTKFPNQHSHILWNKWSLLQNKCNPSNFFTGISLQLTKKAKSCKVEISYVKYTEFLSLNFNFRFFKTSDPFLEMSLLLSTLTKYY